ncbi:MAG: metallophosphoesterase family protein [Myxococcota bacterium]
MVASVSIASGGRALPASDFTIVLLGDTQKQVESRSDLKATVDPNTVDPTDPNLYEHPNAQVGLEAMVDWLVDPAQSEPIELVIQVGDAIEDGGQATATNVSTAEWKIFNHYWDPVKARYPQTLVTRGNHDNPDEFVQHFGDPNAPGGDLRAARISLGGIPALVLLGLPCNPTAAQMAWAEAQIVAVPGRPTILASHIITDPEGQHRKSPPDFPYRQNFPGTCPGLLVPGAGEDPNNLVDPTNPATNIWAELVANHADQIFLTASGHFTRFCTEFFPDSQTCKDDPSWTRREGFKAIRNIGQNQVLDTFQNWLGQLLVAHPDLGWRSKAFIRVLQADTLEAAEADAARLASALDRLETVLEAERAARSELAARKAGER